MPIKGAKFAEKSTIYTALGFKRGLFTVRVISNIVLVKEYKPNPITNIITTTIAITP